MAALGAWRLALGLPERTHGSNSKAPYSCRFLCLAWYCT